MRYLTLGTYPQLEVSTLDNLTAEFTVEVITKDVSRSNVPVPPKYLAFKYFSFKVLQG